MHIPDGLLSAPVSVGTYIAAAGAIGYSVKKLKNFPPEKIPLLGASAAAVFVAQMVNFPVMAGVSGHLLGGALVGILLGPYAGVLVMSAVLLVQALLFGDGGITALGANILTMGVIGPFLGYYLYKYAGRFKMIAAFVAGWLAVMLGAALASVFAGLSGTVPFGKFLTLMLTYHAVIGLIEGVLTVAILAALQKVERMEVAVDEG